MVQYLFWASNKLSAYRASQISQIQKECST